MADAPSGSVRDTMVFEYIVFLLRDNGLSKARDFLKKHVTMEGPWADLCRMFICLLDGTDESRRTGMKLINKWAAVGNELYPPYRIHLVGMARLLGDQRRGSELARDLVGFDWASPSHFHHRKLIKLIAAEDSAGIESYVAELVNDGRMTTMARGELYYHVGIYWLSMGDHEKAAHCLGKVPQFGPFWYGCDFYFARPIIKKLTTDRRWPNGLPETSTNGHKSR